MADIKFRLATSIWPSWKSHVAQFHLSEIRWDQDVCRFDVYMDNIVLMQVYKALQRLSEYASFCLGGQHCSSSSFLAIKQNILEIIFQVLWN